MLISADILAKKSYFSETFPLIFIHSKRPEKQMSRASVTLYPKNALGVVCHRSVTRELLATRDKKLQSRGLSCRRIIFCIFILA